MRFRDRDEAGALLGAHVAAALCDGPDESWRTARPVVLGLPRGGVPVAAGVARALGAPLDVILVRKLGLPSQPELAMGAIGEGGARVVDDALVRRAGVSAKQLAEVQADEEKELERRAHRYRGSRPPISLDGCTVIIVDDGLATGSTARAAIQVARARGARRVAVAVPVAPPDTVATLREDADAVEVLSMPSSFFALGEWYDDFTPTPDDEVVALLADDHEEDVVVAAGSATLPGALATPPGARGVVLFAHGSGSGRHSPRNRSVAETLRRRGFATLLFDLLTPAEAEDRANVFDIPLLGSRLLAAAAWLRAAGGNAALPIGCFGASTGGGAALWAAADPTARVAAVVSRGGRPDLAGERLPRVRCPTLLIVGGADGVVIELNRDAASMLGGEHRLVLVPGATHLFEEPGALDAVARLAGDWFAHHLPGGVAPPLDSL